MGKTKSQRRREKNKAIAESYKLLKAKYEILLVEIESLKQQVLFLFNLSPIICCKINFINLSPIVCLLLIHNYILIITTKKNIPTFDHQSGYSIWNPTHNGGQSGYSIWNPRHSSRIVDDFDLYKSKLH